MNGKQRASSPLLGLSARLAVVRLAGGICLWNAYNQLVVMDGAIRLAWTHVENQVRRWADLFRCQRVNYFLVAESANAAPTGEGAT